MPLLCYNYEMNRLYFFMIIKALMAIIVAIFLGNGTVVWFNHIPIKWFQDQETGELPVELIDVGDGNRQRLTSTPWKLIFTIFYGATGLFLAVRDSGVFTLSTMIVIFIVSLMAICDYKYRIIPDQLNILLAVSAIGFAGFYDKIYEPILGAGIGLALGLATYGLGRLVYKKVVIGGADLKFYMAIGLVTGRKGVVWIFILIAVMAFIHLIYLAINKALKADEQRPMLVYALPAVTIYMLLLFNFELAVYL